MNPHLASLQPYPFQKLRTLFAGVQPNPERTAINLSIGEPKHAAPATVTDALVANLGGLSAYPATQGSDALRQACADWLATPQQKKRNSTHLPSASAVTDKIPR